MSGSSNSLTVTNYQGDFVGSILHGHHSDGIEFQAGSGSAMEPIVIESVGAGSVRLGVFLSHRMSVAGEGSKRPLHMGPHCALVNIPVGIPTVISLMPSSMVSWVSINCSLGSIQPFLDDSLSRSVLDLFEDGNDEIRVLYAPLENQIADAATDLANLCKKDKSAYVFAKSKVTEIICRMLSTRDVNLRKNPTSTPLNQDDIRHIHQVKSFLQESHSVFPQISSLAKSVGTNKTKLTQGFRGLYGVTMSELLTEQRMHDSLTMLTASQYSIEHIANHVGYAHQSSFSTAFKKYYGFTPRHARRNNCQS